MTLADETNMYKNVGKNIYVLIHESNSHFKVIHILKKLKIQQID